MGGAAHGKEVAHEGGARLPPLRGGALGGDVRQHPGDERQHCRPVGARHRRQLRLWVLGFQGLPKLLRSPESWFRV